MLQSSSRLMEILDVDEGYDSRVRKWLTILSWDHEDGDTRRGESTMRREVDDDQSEDDDEQVVLGDFLSKGKVSIDDSSTCDEGKRKIYTVLRSSLYCRLSQDLMSD